MDIVTGTIIEQYEILSRLGVGGMGEVYLAEDHQLGRKVAIKFLPSNLSADKEARSRLIREARAAAKLDHPNICAIHAVGEEGRFIVLQYVKGETLRSRLERESFQPSDALDVAGQIAEALAEAHAHGIIHRDIKPENVMLAERGRVKVLDFGLAKVLHNQAAPESEAPTMNLLSTPGMVMGTVQYMSPEQMRGEILDQRSDIFSFGVVLYELLSGKRPFEAGSTAEIMAAILTKQPPPLYDSLSKISTRLDGVVRKCLEKDTINRYQTINHLILDLEPVCREYDTGLHISSNQATKIASPFKTPLNGLQWLKFISVRNLIAVILSILVVAGGIFFLAIRNQVPPTTPGTKYSNSPGYDYYMRGRVRVSSENRESNEGAIKILEQAVAADPNFAPAYAELARAYNIKSFYYATDEEKKQVNEDAEVAVEKAISLDSDLAEAHFARGLILWTHAKHFPHEQAIRSYKRAIELNPNLDEAHHQLAVVYNHIGLRDKATEELQKTLAINPNNTMARFRLGAGRSISAGKYEEALAELKNIPVETNTSLVTSSIASTMFHLGRTDEAATIVDEYLKIYPNDPGGTMTAVRAMLLAKGGRQNEAEDAIAHAIDLGRGFGHFHHTAYRIGVAYVLMNKPELAMKWLQDAADDGYPCYPNFESDADLNNLRQDERFITFMSKLKQQWQHYKDLFAS